MKKIVFLGNFNVDFTSESHYMKTFRKLGYEVYPLQERSTTAEQILKRASEADMFFWVHTHKWETPGIAEVLSILKDKGIPTVGYHLDLWLGIERQKDLETDPYWGIQYFFSVDPLMVNLLNETPNMPKAYFLRAGVFEDECYIGAQQSQYEHDVIFVGSKGYHHEWPYRRKLIDWLEKNYGERFALYGRDGINQDQIRGMELNNLYATAKVVVGDTLCQNFNYPQYMSDRIFETTGRGGFLIHPYIKGLEECFNLGLDDPGQTHFDKPRELAAYSFNDFDYLRYSIDYFLKNEDEREAIRLAGHNRTKADHTYTSRLKYLLETIGI